MHNLDASLGVLVGVRDVLKAKELFHDFSEIEYLNFDYARPAIFDNIPKDIDVVFVLRPPHIADIPKYYHPFFTALQEKGIQKIVFLSVQGADTSKMIPHYKIETMIKDFGFEYVFLRPSYFMQNLLTTLKDDLVKEHSVVLPAGNAKFNWVDIQNIGEVAAYTLINFDQFRGECLDITGTENLSFQSAVNRLNVVLPTKITYKPVNLFQFFLKKKRQGYPFGLIAVMSLLHFLPRFQKEPEISNVYESVTGQKPTTLNNFVIREKDNFLQ